MASPTVALVIWDDAHGSIGKDVTETDLPHAPMRMTTLGWLLRQDDIGVSLANEKSQEGDTIYYRGHTFIPAKMVVSVSAYTLQRPRQKRAPPSS